VCIAGHIALSDGNIYKYLLSNIYTSFLLLPHFGQKKKTIAMINELTLVVTTIWLQNVRFKIGYPD
jgi:hypothetical protein